MVVVTESVGPTNCWPGVCQAAAVGHRPDLGLVGEELAALVGLHGQQAERDLGGVEVTLDLGDRRAEWSLEDTSDCWMPMNGL